MSPSAQGISRDFQKDYTFPIANFRPETAMPDKVSSWIRMQRSTERMIFLSYQGAMTAMKQHRSLIERMRTQ
jgi:hypothetical protein